MVRVQAAAAREQQLECCAILWSMMSGWARCAPCRACYCARFVLTPCPQFELRSIIEVDVPERATKLTAHVVEQAGIRNAALDRLEVRCVPVAWCLLVVFPPVNSIGAQELAGAGGVYRIRVRPADSEAHGAVMAASPAVGLRCPSLGRHVEPSHDARQCAVVASKLRDTITLHVDPSGAVLAANYMPLKLDCDQACGGACRVRHGAAHLLMRRHSVSRAAPAW